MTQIASSPAYSAIEDRLDAIGQKFRGQRIVRGLLICLAVAFTATFGCALSAHLLGESRWSFLILVLWIAILAGSAIVWLVRPMLIRPTSVFVARMLEERVAGLHNGLTNSVLLAERKDLEGNPWLGSIFDEISNSIESAPVADAVRMKDLAPVLKWATIICLPLLLVFGLTPKTFVHGWMQMMHPAAFVPRQGVAEIVSVMPGDVTLVAGQPLEIIAVTKGDTSADGKLVFDNNSAEASLSGTASDGNSRFSYRMDHVDKSMKYRFESGGTQSAWFAVKVVQQIKLTNLNVKISPPAYTRKEATVLNLKPEQLDSVPVTAAMGSTVSISASVDVAANGAMLQVGEGSPTPMQANSDKTNFTGNAVVNDDVTVAVLLTDGAGQIVSKLPENGLVIHCTKDSAPVVEMRYPATDTVASPKAEVRIAASLKDDYGLVSSRVLMATTADAPMTPVATQQYPAGTTATELSVPLELSNDLRKHGNSIRVQVEATDNRDLPSLPGQVTLSPVYEIKFRDPETLAKEEKEKTDQLRAVLMEMLKRQKDLHEKAIAWKPGANAIMSQISTGQNDLRTLMTSTAQTFAFDESNKMVQKALEVLALNPVKDAVDLSASLASATDAMQQKKLSNDLQTAQRRTISTLESLLALLNASPEPTSQPTTREGDQLVSKPDAYKKLDEALKEFMKEQQKILDQTAGLAKKPVDNFTDKDKKLMSDLLQQEDKLDAFMKAAISDFSKLGEQDMANASMLKDAVAIYSEVTMVKDGLKQQATEIAVPAEEGGLESAKELSSNIEKWLANAPDRQQWTQEELPDKKDTPMPELPKELEDMVGELMEQQEDLFDQVEDMNANITDSADKGVGWDAMDGPIADMSAKGITGNQMPNNNEMGGRSGEGRSGRSQGEFVGDNAVGKGGRNTPTRLDPTAFQQGQVNDTSKDPVGGATGGGKLSGQGQAGLQGPVPPKIQEGLKRLATKQAEIRNTAERLNLQYKLNRYDNFKLMESIDVMRRVESDLTANRYQTALRRRDILLDDLDTSHLLSSSQIHVQQDSTPTTSLKRQQELNDAMKGELPPAWSDALKEYYKKLATQ